MQNPINILNIVQSIYIIRGQKVMLDFDLAKLYDIETGALKRQVRNNIDRFPNDFMFQLSEKEWAEQMQILHLFEKYHKIRALPFAFTEPGVAMLSSVLKSKQAVLVNIEIIRAFIELRKRIINYEDLLRKLDKLEQDSNEKFFEHDRDIKNIFELIQKMITEDNSENSNKIGFNTEI